MPSVDKYTCILLRIKNTLRIKRKVPQKVTAVLRPLQAWFRGQLVVYRTDSEQEVRNRRLSLPPILYNSVYNSQPQLSLQLQDITTTTTTTDYCGRSAYHVYYYFRHYPGRLHLQSQELREVSFQESLILCKEYQLPSTPSLSYYSYWIQYHSVWILEPIAPLLLVKVQLLSLTYHSSNYKNVHFILFIYSTYS
jgi:hypothetical protein